MRNVGLHHAAKMREPFIKRFLDSFKSIKTIDHWMVVIAIIYPLSVLPQIIKIFITSNVESISLLSVCLKSFFALPWIYYGFLHKSKPVIFANCLWFVGYIVLLVQVLMY